jgi:hypothetical protein
MDVSTREVEERDEAGNLTATYIASQSRDSRRVDVVVSHEARFRIMMARSSLSIFNSIELLSKLTLVYSYQRIHIVAGQS